MSSALSLWLQALGYDFMAESYGGYPDGYMRTASQLKILKNAGGAVGALATRQQIVIVLFNALTTDYLVVDGYFRRSQYARDRQEHS